MNAEWVSAWVAIVGIIIMLAGAWMRQLVLKKLDDITTQQISDRELFFKKYDEMKEIFVRKDIYEQAHDFIQEKNDEKFTSLLAVVNTRFENVEEKIDGIKDFINERLNGTKKNGN